MIPTIPYLEQKFDEFNQRIFNNELARPSLELSRARSYRGQCICTRHNRADGTMEYSNFRIRISVSDDRPEHEVQDTLIHEMIHYYIGVKGIQDDAPHGVVFRGLMKHINQHFGRHIAVSHRQKAASSAAANGTSASSASSCRSGRRSYTCVVAVLTLKDGRYAFKVLSRTIKTIVSYYNLVRKSSEFKAVELYLTNDPYFSNYPRSGASYCHIVSNPDFHSHLANAVRVNCDGKNVVVSE